MTASQTERPLTPEDWRALPELQQTVLEAALEVLYERGADPVRANVEAVCKQVGIWHDHDQEDIHCDPDCPAWFPGAYCASCGVQHRTSRPKDES